MAFILVCQLPKIIAFLLIMTPPQAHYALIFDMLNFLCSLLCSNWRATHCLLFTSPWIWVIDCDRYQLQFSLHRLNRQVKTVWQSLYPRYLPPPVTFVIFRKDHKLKVALLWAACDVYSKIIPKIVSIDELKYTVS